MTLKTKIFIGILVVAIILLAGWWVWKNREMPDLVTIVTDKTEYELGKALRIKITNKSAEKLCFSSCYPYSLERKNGDWQSYSYADCQNKDLIEKCVEPRGIKAFELTLFGETGFHRFAVPLCVNCQEGKEFKESKRLYSNEFKIIKGKEGTKKPEVTITPDKTEYEQGETVEIIVSNELTNPIWLFRDSSHMFSPLLRFQSWDGGKWEKLQFVLPYLTKEGKEACSFMELMPVVLGEALKLEPISEINFNLPRALICKGTEPEILKEGTYRAFIRYGLNEETNYSDLITIYSNEFRIK